MNDKYLDLIYRENEFVNSKGKKFEYFHLVKAITKLDNVGIVKSIEEPDFILRQNDKNFGIEIVTLVDPQKAKRSGFIQNVLNLICRDISNDYLQKYVLSVYFFDDIKIVKKNMFEECKQVIKHYLEYSILKENNYIKKIVNGGRNSIMNLCFNPGGYMSLELTEDILNSFVYKKNCKIDQYKENLKGNECWLLLVANKKEYYYDLFDDLPPNLTIKYDFDKVLLLHDFNNDLFEWNNDKWHLI
ncbi:MULTISPECIES: hypothetical protein [Myroides]|nr:MULTISPECIES: hypothetical protein [Myroides]APA92995.1 hypothetical protein BK054_12365 [Myroides sp. ZB35]MDM1034664.1 hypothetical protein [Myroides odoratimimus]MDM1038462.1 hypothetical protein [Myroides odoratimimus]MDM1053934.1 hypothetical protein [Myroides odoratimimus]MDM1459598.1 hypothetical protein [Myroides odoratimimus]